MKMRTEREMMNLILRVAKADGRIRAVLLEGSRANPEAPKDVYQDYDVNFFVTEIEPFISDPSWLSAFGNPLIVQEPEWVDSVTGFFDARPGDCPRDFSRFYSWLALFDDGNRIDFSFIPADNRPLLEKNGEPVVVLLDKDGLLPACPPPSGSVYRVQAPDENKFHGCCNEFWWCLNNAAKGIARDELPYAMEMLNRYVRDMLNKMAEWRIGVQTGFSVSAGKMGKYLGRYLPPELYAGYVATYSGSDYGDIWAAVDTMCDLFHTLATSVAAHFGFTYRQSEEDGMRAYLRMVRQTTMSEQN